MVAPDVPLDRTRPAGRPRASVRWYLTAAGLFLGSSVLQLIASLQRWVTFSDAWRPGEPLIEDNLFDYSYPADPWQNLGTAAQYFGAGYLLLSLGVYALLRAAPAHRNGRLRVLALIVVSSFALDGGHALLSGLFDAPTPIQHVMAVLWLLSLVAFGCLIVLGVMWVRTSWAVSLACLFLLGATVPGYLWAMFTLAPLITGYQSHDTTPWTETVVAASTAAAGVSVLLAAGVAAISRWVLSRARP
jgi:hypothetical protein